MAEWYYIESGQTRGPVDDEAIRVLASVGRLTAASQLMPAGTSTWSTLGAYESQLGLQRTATGGYGPAGTPPPPPPPGYAPSTSRVWRASARVRGAATWIWRLWRVQPGDRPSHDVRSYCVALVEASGRVDHRHDRADHPVEPRERHRRWHRDDDGRRRDARRDEGTGVHHHDRRCRPLLRPAERGNEGADRRQDAHAHPGPRHRDRGARSASAAGSAASSSSMCSRSPV